MASVYSSSSQGPSRANSRNGQHPRPPLDRMPSTFSDTPVATNSALNKVASASSSLYQNCRTVLERLYRVPGFAERFIDPAEAGGEGAGGAAGAGMMEGQDGGLGGAVSSDPVSRSLHTLRLGSSLCFLFNALALPHQLDVNPAATMSNLKACQRGTAHFVMACKQDLRWADQDLFAIHELYGQDTNGVVKVGSIALHRYMRKLTLELQVINTVTKLLDLLEEQGVLLEAPEAPETGATPAGPSDDRTMVVREILDSERKYVQDLEVLQDYQRQVQANDIITQDQIHHLFLNLNTLADFQRRFLIGVEANASRPPDEQRFGHLFLQMEDHFSVYEPYCANLTAAQDLAIAENAALGKLSNVLDPVSELAPLLIKPVQRLCKYPLLLATLVKNTPDTTPHYAELQSGLESIMRVTDKVNETKRREDNRQAVIDLGRRVEDWKGHDITSFGELLLQETFFVIKNDSEREYNVYLFERIILCCKESGNSGKKSNKSNSIAKKPVQKKPTMLQLKGRIFVNNVTGAQAHHRNGQCLLEVRWRGDVAEEAFTIKCRTEELLKQWQKTITKTVEDSSHRRRQQHLSSGRRSDRGIASPMSQFPATPITEMGPQGSSIYSYGSEASSPYPYANPAQPSFPPGHHANAFDDEYEDGFSYEPTESGRSTPSTMARRAGSNTRSLPAEQRDQQQYGASRPRAHTEDSSSAVINQWRNQTPGSSNGPPSLPRGASHASNGSESHSLRSSASSRQLRSKQSSEWGGQSPAMGYGRLPGDEETTPRQGSAGVSRQASHGQVPSSYPQAPPLVRNRSASSPNIYQPGFPPPMSSPQLSEQEWATYQQAGASRHPYAQYSSNGGVIPGGQGPSSSASRQALHKSSGTNSGGTLASASSASTNKKRFSSSSNGTDRSSATSNHSLGASPSSGLPPSGSLPSLPSA
uniref:DH domain-containing protein n=1 Tax=Leucosporidium scottii TaxID=5278 RepID=A0A0H5FS88_9BASI|nr:hypothetical protein ls5931a1_00043 [Leucosporidium scottii]